LPASPAKKFTSFRDLGLMELMRESFSQQLRRRHKKGGVTRSVVELFPFQSNVTNLRDMGYA
jgi:hypothetical protein